MEMSLLPVMPNQMLGLQIQPLSERELQCLYLASLDKSMRETARIMEIKETTVRWYRKRILEKTACRHVAGAVRFLYIT